MHPTSSTHEQRETPPRATSIDPGRSRGSEPLYRTGPTFSEETVMELRHSGGAIKGALVAVGIEMLVGGALYAAWYYVTN